MSDYKLKKAKLNYELSKFNPYHDKLGRFSTAQGNITGAGSASLGGGAKPRTSRRFGRKAGETRAGHAKRLEDKLVGSLSTKHKGRKEMYEKREALKWSMNTNKGKWQDGKVWTPSRGKSILMFHSRKKGLGIRGPDKPKASMKMTKTMLNDYNMLTSEGKGKYRKAVGETIGYRQTKPFELLHAYGLASADI